MGSGGGRALFSQSEYLELFEQDGAELVSRKFFMIDDALHTIADIFFVDWMSKEFTDKDSDDNRYSDSPGWVGSTGKGRAGPPERASVRI